MSSHHIQSLSDPNYLLRLQNMRISADADAMSSAAVLQNRRTNSLNGGNTIEGNEFGMANARVHNMNAVGNRQPYIDRGALVSVSKLSNAYLNNSSPTHSLSGSSQHSGSPRTSLVTNLVGAPMHMHSSSHDGQRMVSATGPVYENLDSYYGPNIKSTQPFAYTNHYVPVGVGNVNSSNSSVGGGTYEVIGKKLDSNGSRFAHTPQPPDIIESTPIYENLSNVSGEPAIAIQTWPGKIIQFLFVQGQRGNSSVPPPPPPPLLPKKSIQLQNQNDTSGTYVQPQLILSQKYRHDSPNHSMSASENVSPLVARNVQYQNSRNNLIAASEKNPTIATYTAQLVCNFARLSSPHPFEFHLTPLFFFLHIISAKFSASDEHVDESKLY